MTTASRTTLDAEQDRQCRSLVVAVVGAWVGFLGLMAIAAHQATPLGAVALITGFTVLVLALRRVIQEGPSV